MNRCVRGGLWMKESEERESLRTHELSLSLQYFIYVICWNVKYASCISWTYPRDCGRMRKLEHHTHLISCDGPVLVSQAAPRHIPKPCRFNTLLITKERLFCAPFNASHTWHFCGLVQVKTGCAMLTNNKECLLFVVGTSLWGRLDGAQFSAHRHPEIHQFSYKNAWKAWKFKLMTL